MKPISFRQRILDPRRLKAIHVRTQVETGIRRFFLQREFQEVRTPLIVVSPGMEPHIRPFQIKSSALPDQTHYLPTSPEFAMKKLLVGGLEKIFQICPAFRDEPHSLTHRPEFTLLEWYRAHSNLEDIMKDTEELVEALALELYGQPSFPFQGRQISVQTPWPRLQIRDLFQKHVQLDLTQCRTLEQMTQECQRLKIQVSPGETWDDLYFKIWLDLIEPHLPTDQAVFVTRYPASQAALAVIDQDPDGSAWARRFEFYAGGIELGNAFEELTDPIEQRARFVQDMDLREAIYGDSLPRSPIDEEFIQALEEGLPPSGGIAVGVDRLIMLLADEPDIAYTQWL
jgi:elongation factor P--(R)-beta-lysine ligase